MDKITDKELADHYESVTEFFLHMLTTTGDEKYNRSKDLNDENAEQLQTK